YELSKEYNETKLFFDFCISFFCKSCSYKMANKLFPILIYPYYKYYDFETLKKLINESSYNKQICERERAEIEHRCIANQFVNIGGTLDDIENHQSSWDIFISDIIKEKECNNA
ncbi:MAG: hypothetical protein PUH01_09255, partial [Pseudomonadota bacterium]|nr:hypothetical protein [Pseudomonadota bacterium]